MRVECQWSGGTGQLGGAEPTPTRARIWITSSSSIECLQHLARVDGRVGVCEHRAAAHSQLWAVSLAAASIVGVVGRASERRQRARARDSSFALSPPPQSSARRPALAEM